MHNDADALDELIEPRPSPAGKEGRLRAAAIPAGRVVRTLDELIGVRPTKPPSGEEERQKARAIRDKAAAAEGESNLSEWEHVDESLKQS